MFGSKCTVDPLSGGATCTCPEKEKCVASKSASVCGSDGITYDSECHLQVESCKTQTDIRVHEQRPCGQYNNNAYIKLSERETHTHRYTETETVESMHF